MRVIDLNADLGEGAPYDEVIIPLVSSANIACGGHAGDDQSMSRAVMACIKHGTAIGAHPGHDDREHFGRVAREVAVDALHTSLARQLAALATIAEAKGSRIRHVKPHGALYHQANSSVECARVLVRAMRETVAHDTLLVGPPAGSLAEVAHEAGIPFRPEGFVDRGYLADGSLVPRGQPGDLIMDPARAAAQALGLAAESRVSCVDGSPIPLRVDTLCLHGDGASAVNLLVRIRAVLAGAGIGIRA